MEDEVMMETLRIFAIWDMKIDDRWRLKLESKNAER